MSIGYKVMPRMMGGMMGGRGMMGGGRAQAVTHAMAHSAMSMMGGGMMGGGMSTSQQTGIPQLPAGMMHHGSIKNLDKGGSTAQKFTNAQVASVSSGMGIAGMMGGMMGGVMTFDYGDKFNRQDIKEMKAQGFSKQQINRYIKKQDLGGTRAGGRFQEKVANRNAVNSTAYKDLLGNFNELQTQFDELKNNQGSVNTSTGSGDNYSSAPDPQSQQIEEDKEQNQLMDSESAMPFGSGSNNNITVGFPTFTYPQSTSVPQPPSVPQPETVQQPVIGLQGGGGTSNATSEQATSSTTNAGTGTTSSTGTGTNQTSFIPYNSTDYFNTYGNTPQNQQIYTQSGGQGFYAAAQFKPVNPFTGKPYAVGEDGLPDNKSTYPKGSFLPGQLKPLKMN